MYKLVYFRGCPNLDKARKFLRTAEITKFQEVVQDDLSESDPLKRVSSPSIIGPSGELLVGQTCEFGTCTFVEDGEALRRLKQASHSHRSILSPLLGTGGSLGLLALIGACGGTCSLLAAPLAGVLVSFGFVGLAPWLPVLRIPLLSIAIILAVLSLVRIHRYERRWVSSAAAMVLIAAISASFAATSGKQESIRGMALYLKTLTPETQDVVKNGIYRTWIRLGHAPSQKEVQSALGPDSGKKVERAFEELQSGGFSEIFASGTRDIRWFWPLSSQDHGVSVTLTGEKTVFARCAVDALGMSQMFGKPSTISIRTPLLDKRIEFAMNGSELTKFNSSVVVSKGNGCNDLLFFSSEDEFIRFKEKTGRTQLKMMTLKDAVAWGLASFGSILSS